MITELTAPFVKAKSEFINWLTTQDDPSYESLLRKSLELAIAGYDDQYGNEPDPERIHVINDGDYQGLFLFVIGAKGYQPSTYWYTQVFYGSCSGCDTLEGAWGYARSNRNMDGMYLIALHMMQQLRKLEEEGVEDQ